MDQEPRIGEFAGPRMGEVGKDWDLRVASALEAHDVKYQVDEDGCFFVAWEFENGRSHTCLISSRTEEFGGVEFRVVQAPCCQLKQPPDANVANRLLLANNVMHLGAWFMAVIGASYAIGLKIYIAADCPAEELVSVAFAVCKQADEIEKDVTGADEF